MVKNKNQGKSKVILIIVILIFSVALFVATKLVQKNQENRSKATSSVEIGDDYCNLDETGHLDCSKGSKSDIPEDIYKTGTKKEYPNQTEYRWTCGPTKCALKGPLGTSSTSRCGTKVNECKIGKAYQKPNDLTDNTGNKTEYRWSCVSGGYTEICTQKTDNTAKSSSTKTVAKTVDISKTNNSDKDWQTFNLTCYSSLPEENGGYKNMACPGSGAVADVKTVPGKDFSTVIASYNYKCGTKIYLAEPYNTIFTVKDTGARFDLLIPRRANEGYQSYKNRVNKCSDLPYKNIRGYIIEPKSL